MLWSSCDGFIELEFGGQTHKTQVVKNSFSPVWEDQFTVSSFQRYHAPELASSQKYHSPKLAVLRSADFSAYCSSAAVSPYELTENHECVDVLR